MRPFIYCATCVATALFLAACGGGGSGGTPALSNDEQQALTAYRQALGGQPLNLSSSQIRSALTQRANAADRLLLTDVLAIDFSLSDRYPTSCAGAYCTVFGVRTGLSDLDLQSATYLPLMTRNRVSVAAAEYDITYSDGTSDQSVALGAWLDHNVAFVGVETSVDAANTATGVYFYGGSFGNDTESNPVSGPATWTGVMVGMDTINIQAIQGDATLRADFTAANLDIAFTNIHDDELARRADIRWNDVPMVDGAFYAPGIQTGDKIEGTFYGPAHAEAGGVFEHGATVGAFGAGRQ